MIFHTWNDLVILDMTGVDAILNMNSLSYYYVLLNFNANTMTLEIPSREKLEWEGINNLIQLRPYLSSRQGNWRG